MLKPKKIRIRKYACELYQKAVLEYLDPPEDMKVSEWAERYRMLDGKASAEPGPWNNSRTPYLVEIMDELLNHETEEIIFCKCTQIGGTEVELNMLGYVVQQDPAPAEVVYPIETMATSVAEHRIKPMIESTPTLYKKYDRNSSNLELNFTDMFIKLVWSNSPSGLASFAMKYLFLDEVKKKQIRLVLPKNVQKLSGTVKYILPAHRLSEQTIFGKQKKEQMPKSIILYLALIAENS